MAVTGIEAVWEKTLGDRRLTIAVIDGPVDLHHPCFAGASLDQVNGTGASACEAAGPESCAHGTHVASVLFAQHGRVEGLRGIAPGCHGLIVPLFRDDPEKKGQILPASQTGLASALQIARQRGASIINVSGGELSNHGHVHPALQDAVRQCVEQGVLIVAAAGNDGCECMHVPASLPGVLAVGAATRSGFPAAFSNFGRAYQSQGLLAPGHGIPGAQPGGGLVYRSGTSFAAPIVSGVAALLLSLKAPSTPPGDSMNKASAEPIRTSRPTALRLWPAAAVQEVRDNLMLSASPCRLGSATACKRFLVGTLDVRKAFHLTLHGELTMNENGAEVRGSEATLDAPTNFGGQDGAALELSSCSCELSPRTNQPGTPDQAQPVEEEEETRPRGTAGAGSSRPPAALARPASFHPPRQRMRLSGEAAAVHASCECEGAGPLAYALGEIGYDFGTLARQDSIVFEMDERTSPSNPAHLIAFLKKNPHFMPSVIWTLNLDANPIYAIKPDGTYAKESYARILEFYNDQINNESERAAIPGTIKGQVTLYSGQVVPVICPEYRGMTNWRTAQLRDAVGEATMRARAAATGQKPEERKGKQAGAGRAGRDDDEAFLQMENFLNRIYFELRNMGVSPQERALNYAATNAFVPGTVVERVALRGLLLDDIEVVQSPICRKDSDCWDVKLIFFDSRNVLASRYVSRFTVDVSDVVPVIVGAVREWNIR